MNMKEVDSKVLRIMIETLNNHLDDPEVGEHGHEDARFWLEMIGKTFIAVTGWSVKDSQNKKDE